MKAGLFLIVLGAALFFVSSSMANIVTGPPGDMLAMVGVATFLLGAIAVVIGQFKRR
ncbi:MAG: hypothetical protein IPL47_04480 [Phyllobacteriaceae bacterium]|nr:hypothetical protein [Phyllobacteriaceae bacterium]